MKLNVLQCDTACVSCIKSYKKKHDLKPGDGFKIACSGIPKEYIPAAVADSMPEADLKSMLSMVDPVTWAAEVLDWHCEDPDGAIWKRKTAEGSLGAVTPYIEEKHSELVKEGKSAFHRPYQKVMLRCTAQRNVVRCGRQLGKSEVLIIKVLFAAFTHKDFKIILVAPYQSQIDMLFKRIESAIKASPKTKNSIKRYVKAPNYTIELHNGTTIRGFTAGTKSGGNADAVRGQAANMLCFDESDYLSSSDVASALAVITNYPDASVWMSSTPTGKRERFYDNCHSSIWKEFYYRSHENPLWSDDLEQFYRNEFTDIQYDHEINANFGEQEQGVYLSKYVDDALIDYHYEDNSPDPSEWFYTIGVDWNDFKVGTTMAVIGFNPRLRLFKLMTRVVYQRENWTQIGAIEEIIKLNRYWNPKWIYIDYGYGATQHELIKKYGYDSLGDPDKGPGHPDGRLHRITKQYNFGSKITIRDLFTKQPVDKEAKPFLIENSIRRFEQRAIHISKYDTQLESELRGYIIDHVTTTGAPVYKQGNEKVGDHNLDALCLALVAVTLEESDFGKPAYDVGIGFVPPMGTNISQPKPGQPLDPGAFKSNQKKIDIKNNKPNMARNDFQPPKLNGGQVAGANLNKPKNGLWAWPGFERDAPAPVRNNINPLGRSRPAPPSRKKW